MCEICQNTWEEKDHIQVCKWCKKLPETMPDVKVMHIEYNYKIGKIPYLPKCEYLGIRNSNICHITKRLLPKVKQLNLSFSKVKFIPANMENQLELVRARGLKDFKYPEGMKDIVHTEMYTE